MDYRESYKECFGINFPTTMEVHHINGRKDDNSIDNLLLLPRELHNRLHTCNAQMFGNRNEIEEMAKRTYNLACKYGGFAYELMALSEFAETMREVAVWGLLKYLEYRKPSGERIANIDENSTRWITTRG